RKAVDSAFRLLHDLTADEQSGLVGPSTNR
ncbi:MAG: hypothetical protein JWL73_361, partial [Actinomycetia bacterium]|nr:hypothetical protein [Actinomycetes bacterium]